MSLVRLPFSLGIGGTLASIETAVVRLLGRSRSIERKMDDLMATVVEAFNALREQTSKVYGEITGKISALQAAVDALTAELNSRELTDAEEAALGAVRDQLSLLDDIVPDAAPVEPAPEPEPEPTPEPAPEGGETPAEPTAGDNGVPAEG